MNENFYEILELEKNCYHQEIKKQFKDLILKYHPDKLNSPDYNYINKLILAYNVLSNKEQRESYDKSISNNELKSSFYNFTTNIEFDKDKQEIIFHCDQCEHCNKLDIKNVFAVI